jgi:acyl-CoA dehydrogenase
MISILWLVALIGVPIALVYRRTSLAVATGILVALLFFYSFFGPGPLWWKFLLWVGLVPVAALNLVELRRDVVTRPLLRVYRRMLPKISQTERDALEAGNVWWEGELFSGNPDWEQLLKLPVPELTGEEQAFLDGPTDELCGMIDDWEITHELADLPQPVWELMRRRGFFALIIP